MSDYTEPTPAPEPVLESDQDDYLDEDEPDNDDDWDDWKYATSSDRIAEVLIDKLDEKVLTKVMWTRIIAAMHAAYYDNFLERVEVDDAAPKMAT